MSHYHIVVSCNSFMRFVIKWSEEPDEGCKCALTNVTHDNGNGNLFQTFPNTLLSYFKHFKKRYVMHFFFDAM